MRYFSLLLRGLSLSLSLSLSALARGVSLLYRSRRQEWFPTAGGARIGRRRRIDFCQMLPLAGRLVLPVVRYRLYRSE